MTLSAPSMVVFLVAVILAILALAIMFVPLAIGVPAFWVMTAAFVVLAIGCLLTGL